MTILYLLYYFLLCNLSSFFSQILNQGYLFIYYTIFEAVKELHKAQLKYWSTPALENNQYKLHTSRKQ